MDLNALETYDGWQAPSQGSNVEAAMINARKKRSMQISVVYGYR